MWMELRKVQLTGGSSLAMTLPKSWTERSRIAAGDMIGLAEQADGSLSVYPQPKGKRPVNEYLIEVAEQDPERLFRKIVAAYLTGYDVIRLQSKRPMGAEMRRTIRDATRRIVALEVVEEQADAVVLQDFLDPREFDMERAVRRMRLLCQAMQEDALAALRKRPTPPAAGIEDSDTEVDRLYWLLNKQYHAILRDSTYAAKMNLNATQALNFLLAARLIERTADHAQRISSELGLLTGVKLPEALVSQFEKQGRKAVELFQGALQTFFGRDLEKANATIEEAEKFREAQKRMIRDASEVGGEAVGHLSLIIESIARTAAYAADVSEVAINHYVASPAKA
jgi:phosphate uptake regulator